MMELFSNEGGFETPSVKLLLVPDIQDTSWSQSDDLFKSVPKRAKMIELYDKNRLKLSMRKVRQTRPQEAEGSIFKREENQLAIMHAGLGYCDQTCQQSPAKEQKKPQRTERHQNICSPKKFILSIEGLHEKHHQLTINRYRLAKITSIQKQNRIEKTERPFKHLYKVGQDQENFLSLVPRNGISPIRVSALKNSAESVNKYGSDSIANVATSLMKAASITNLISSLNATKNRVKSLLPKIIGKYPQSKKFIQLVNLNRRAYSQHKTKSEENQLNSAPSYRARQVHTPLFILAQSVSVKKDKEKMVFTRKHSVHEERLIHFKQKADKITKKLVLR